jgi:hypothetical protein
MGMDIVVSVSREAWEALLAALPRCPCGALAEVELNGRVACVPCAASVRRGRCRTLDHTHAMGAIVDALSPHVPAGKWTEQGG